ncbi:MAG: c-type cytochrome [Bacteroidota bacterium]|nr:c-type cytochrome [Bacteroidota bacterium]
MKHILVVMVIFFAADQLSAQQWKWPDQPKNLTALPASTAGKDLQRVMFGFTGSLGVRCTYCHVGEEGKDFKEFDFVSDAKPAKNKARLMIKMVKNINTQFLTNLHDDNSPAIQVNCQTCHRGNALPILLEDQLKKTFDKSGIDSTIKQYRALREQFYGGFTYNFKEGSLLRLADKISEDSTKMPAAIEIIKLNIEMYPSFAFSYTHLASYFEDLGNKQGAIENYQKALSLNPKNEMIKRQLDKLQSK